MKRSWLWTSLAVGLVPGIAHAEPVVFEPAGNWVMEYGEDSCVLGRQFSSGDESALLQLLQFGPGNDFELRISSTVRLPNRNVSVSYAPGAEGMVRNPDQIEMADGTKGLLLSAESMRPEIADAARSGTTPAWSVADRDLREKTAVRIVVNGGGGKSVVLATGSLHPAMSAMRTCIGDLAVTWGLDGDANVSLSREAALADFQKLEKAGYGDDVPAFFKAMNGKVLRLRVFIDAEGTPSRCTIAAPDDVETYVKQLCDSFLSGTGIPALDASGKPIASVMTRTLTYRVVTKSF